MWEVQHHSLGAPHTAVWAVCFVAFIVLFSISTRDGPRGLLILITQSALALICIRMQTAWRSSPRVLLVIVRRRTVRRDAAPVRDALSGRFGGRPGPDRLLPSVMPLPPSSAPIPPSRPLRSSPCGWRTRERRVSKRLAEANTEMTVATELLQISSRADDRIRVAPRRPQPSRPPPHRAEPPCSRWRAISRPATPVSKSRRARRSRSCC